MASPITPDLVYSLVNVSGPDISPRGDRAAFVKSWVDDDAGEERSQVQMIDLDNGTVASFTHGPKDSNPQFSSDGESLAFLRPDDKERKQIWVMKTNGGEAVQITDLHGGVSDFAWAPNGQRIAVVSNVDPDQPEDDHDSKKDPMVKVVNRIKYRHDVLGWRGDGHRQLFVVEIGGEARQLTQGDYENYAPVWSPDGSQIAFISERSADKDLFDYSQAYVAPASGGEPTVWSSGLHTVAALGWSPDGSKLVAVGSDVESGSASYQGWLYVLQPGEDPRRLTDDSIKPVAGFPPQGPFTKMLWTGDGVLYFLADARGESFLCSVPVEGGEVKRIYGGGAQLTAVSLDGDASKAVLLSVPSDSPGDIHLVDVTGGNGNQLTDYNREYLQEHPPAKLSKFQLDRAGFDIESRVLLPPGFDESKVYPMVLEIHGGPNGVFMDAFSTLHQVLATAGYIVLAVNPRGSSTYGGDFTMAVLNDWGGEDYLDIMQAVDEMVSKPYVDESRLGVHGYSYGGYMTSWTVGHTDRFKAAVVGAPCIDLSSMAGTSDIGISFGEKQWGGRRDVVFDEMMKRSPITYAPQVNTPVLLLHGETDYRCPIGQSEQYFVSLKRLGKEVEFVRFPGGAHGFRNSGHPKMRKEYLQRVLDWFNRYLA